MKAETKKREIEKCKSLLERQKLSNSQRHNLEVYLKSLEEEKVTE